MSRPERPGGVGYVLRKFPVLSETFVLNELLALEARGAPLYLFSLYRPNDPRFHEDLPKLKARVSYVPGLSEMRKLLRHHRRAAKSFGGRYLRTLLYAASHGRPTLFWRLLQAAYVANEARRLGLRHLHAQFANRPTTVACFAARLTGLPFSFTAHATDIFKDRVSRTALARKVADARFVVTVSEFNREYLERVTGAAPGKVVRIYNGIDLERFAPNGAAPPAPFTLLCVARLVEKKGLPVLIEACRHLRDRGLEFRCGIVGKGVLRPRLEALIRRGRLEDHVRLLGPHTQGEVQARYREAHLYV
ncbi:MAG: glycosyltransferase, partial [Burkholderiales bacterium]